MMDAIHQARSALRRRARELRGNLAELEAEITELGPGDHLTGLHLVLEAAGRRALVSAAQVEEVARGVDLSPVRGGPPEAAGLVNVGGRPMAALDLAAFFGVRRPAPRDATLLVFEASVPFGLLADAVSPAPEPPLLVAGGHDGGRWRYPGVLAQTGGEVLPLVHVERLASILEAPAEPSGRLEAQLARQLSRLEASLERRGLQLSQRLRARLRMHLAGVGAETGLRASEVIPEILGGDPASICTLLEEAVVGETFFFRHPGQLEALRRLLFGSADPGRVLRLWSAGCGSGEEAYGLAALLSASGRIAGRDRILATDVSERALQHAREARYGRWSFRGVAAEMECLLPGAPHGTEVPDRLRAMVEILRHDVREDAPEGGFDAVLCRNVLSFLEPDAVPAALQQLFEAARPGGYLLLAPSEMYLADGLQAERVEVGDTVLLRRPWSRRPEPGRPAPRNGSSAP
jgi:chemotaxis methyl-accepting protein methylase